MGIAVVAAAAVQLAMTVRVLLKYIGGVNECAADALSLWLSHHITNCGYKWIWNEWFVISHHSIIIATRWLAVNVVV